MQNVLKMPIGDYSCLKRSAYAAYKENRYFESAVLIHCAMEYTIKLWLAIDKKLSDRFWKNDRLTFSKLVDFCEIAGMKQSSIRELREFNKKRNELVHQPISHIERHQSILVSSINAQTIVFNDASLNKLAEEIFKLGSKIFQNGSFFE